MKIVTVIFLCVRWRADYALLESAYTYSFIDRGDVSPCVFNGGQEEQQGKILSSLFSFTAAYGLKS